MGPALKISDDERRRMATTANLTIYILAVTVLWFLLIGPPHAEAKSNYKTTTESYTVPDVTLINQNGLKIPLKSVFRSGKPVMIDFIFTTCTTICPVLSAGFANFQRVMGPEADRVHLVSISIDPENDTPRKMKDYLRRYGAKQGWDFLTGSRSDIDNVNEAFHTNAAIKMSHIPLILIWSPGSGRWMRIYGHIGTSDLLKEYRRAAAD